MQILKKYNLIDGFLVNYQRAYHPGQTDVFRICIAGFSLISFLVLLSDYHSILHPEGIMNWEASKANLFWFELHLQKISTLSGIKAEYVLISSSIFYVISLILLILGKYIRISAIIAFLLFYSFSNITTVYGYGADIYQNVSLLLLCFFPLGYYYSISPKKETRLSMELSSICIRCLQLYLIITYFASGTEKAVLSNWWDGRYLFGIMNDPTMYSLIEFTPDFTVGQLIFISIITIIIESLYFLLIWIPLVRSIHLCCIIGMHLFIAFFLSMPLFGIIMITLNISCWYPCFLKDYNHIKSNMKLR